MTSAVGHTRWIRSCTPRCLRSSSSSKIPGSTMNSVWLSDGARAGMGASEKPDLKAEFSNISHVRGTCSMARSQNPNSANSQFFICFTDAPWLNKQYSVWGQVIEGMDNVDKIKKGEPVPDPDSIVSIKVAADVA